jgi:hypothetical protein
VVLRIARLGELVPEIVEMDINPLDRAGGPVARDRCAHPRGTTAPR